MFEEPKFIVDFMLGRLAGYLRNLGYDARYLKPSEKNSIALQKEIAFESLREKRIVLTRNHKVSPKRSWKLILLKSNDPGEQLKQVLETLNLKLSKDANAIFTVCSVCNVAIVSTPKEHIKHLVPEYVFETQNVFFTCPSCKRVYWRGTHYNLFLAHLKKIGLSGL